MAAKCHSALSVAIGALLALWAAAGVAVAGGQALARFVKVKVIRRVTTLVLLVLAAFSLVEAVR